MSASQRAKGQAGERELAAAIAEHTGWTVRRRVRQHAGDSDLEGVPGWSVECKRYKSADPSQIEAWWAQAVRQAGVRIPVLFYRLDRRQWRAVWPLAVALKIQSADMWVGMEWTAETSVSAWAAVAREIGHGGATEQNAQRASAPEDSGSGAGTKIA